MSERSEFLKKWTEALRSGEYTKTEGTYYDPSAGCMCTLGLGGFLFVKDELDGTEDHEKVVCDGMDALLRLFPELRPTADWDGRWGKNLWHQVTSRNDGGEFAPQGKPATFSEMADFLEEKLGAE